MVDSTPQGAMAMVRIDGARVKQLREQKGLTQLYVATVVQVTTDTISRWENKKYPTIKRDNALRLAEALEVPLEEVLETTASEEELDESPANDEQKEQPTTADRRRRSRWMPAVAAFAVAAAFIAILLWYFLQHRSQPRIYARRILPAQCTAGQPFPVAIQVYSRGRREAAIILKERVPPDVQILATEPPLSPANLKDHILKWLQKGKGKMLFTYVATIKAGFNSKDSFSGTVASSKSKGSPVAVAGNGTIRLTNHHWADTNGDNVISDKEILQVYGQYGDLQKLNIDIDQIEEMWLGSGYRWDPKQKKYIILP